MLYKNRYLIGFYSPVSDGETLVGLCANVREFSEMMGIGVTYAYQVLNRLFTKKQRFVMVRGRLCTAEFIPEDDECEKGSQMARKGA